MKQSPLDRVLSVEKTKEKQASVQLHQARVEHEKLTKQLTHLEEYRDLYESRLEQEKDKAIDACTLQDYRLFLSNLNRAEAGQSERIEQTEQGVDTLEQHWLELNRSKSSIEKLLQDRRTEEIRVGEIKQDQLNQDQFAARPKPKTI